MVILGDPEMVDVFMQSRKTFQPLYQSQFFPRESGYYGEGL